LGALSAGTSLNIKITLPNPLSATLSWLTLSLYQMDGNSYVSVPLNTIASTNTNAEYKYDITFPSSDTVSAEYELRAIGPRVIPELDYFYLEVTSYNTSAGLSVASNSMQTVLKVT
jgi:hypothetical protein